MRRHRLLKSEEMNKTTLMANDCTIGSCEATSKPSRSWLSAPSTGVKANNWPQALLREGELEEAGHRLQRGMVVPF